MELKQVKNIFLPLSLFQVKESLKPAFPKIVHRIVIITIFLAGIAVFGWSFNDLKSSTETLFKVTLSAAEGQAEGYSCSGIGSSLSETFTTTPIRSDIPLTPNFSRPYETCYTSGELYRNLTFGVTFDNARFASEKECLDSLSNFTSCEFFSENSAYFSLSFVFNGGVSLSLENTDCSPFFVVNQCSHFESGLGQITSQICSNFADGVFSPYLCSLTREVPVAGALNASLNLFNFTTWMLFNVAFLAIVGIKVCQRWTGRMHGASFVNLLIPEEFYAFKESHPIRIPQNRAFLSVMISLALSITVAISSCFYYNSLRSSSTEFVQNLQTDTNSLDVKNCYRLRVIPDSEISLQIASVDVNEAFASQSGSNVCSDDYHDPNCIRTIRLNSVNHGEAYFLPKHQECLQIIENSQLESCVHYEFSLGSYGKICTLRSEAATFEVHFYFNIEQTPANTDFDPSVFWTRIKAQKLESNIADVVCRTYMDDLYPPFACVSSKPSYTWIQILSLVFSLSQLTFTLTQMILKQLFLRVLPTKQTPQLLKIPLGDQLTNSLSPFSILLPAKEIPTYVSLKFTVMATLIVLGSTLTVWFTSFLSFSTDVVQGDPYAYLVNPVSELSQDEDCISPNAPIVSSGLSQVLRTPNVNGRLFLVQLGEAELFYMDDTSCRSFVLDVVCNTSFYDLQGGFYDQTSYLNNGGSIKLRGEPVDANYANSVTPCFRPAYEFICEPFNDDPLICNGKLEEKKIASDQTQFLSAIGSATGLSNVVFFVLVFCFSKLFECIAFRRKQVGQIITAENDLPHGKAETEMNSTQ